jgi:hypothetical protein
MAKVDKGAVDKTFLGLAEESYADATREGIYHDVLEPTIHADEYSAKGITFKNGRQHSFPSGKRYGGDAGVGKKMKGSD